MRFDGKSARALCLLAGLLAAAPCRGAAADPPAPTARLTLGNEQVLLTVSLAGGRLAGDRLEGRPAWLSEHGATAVVFETDGDFAIELVYTGWLAPGRAHNADNLLVLGKADFEVVDHDRRGGSGGEEILRLRLRAEQIPLELDLEYSLAPRAFWVRRSLTVRDERSAGHYLQAVWPVRAAVGGATTVLKAGGFGGPVALRGQDGGTFFGLEYPAGTNRAQTVAGAGLRVEAGQEIGRRVDAAGVAGEPVVWGLAPDRYVKRWFERYLDSVRVAPVRPYVLYNTWYDVRSPEYTERAQDVMDEQNLTRILADFRRVMQRHPGLALDAFVLDDGWDVYASDWALRREEFPRGLGPVRAAASSIGAGLGIWFGPTGGYSLRRQRIDWMGQHGYELVGDQLCLAGRRYRDLLERRTVDLVRDEGVSYFKWDGIQFSCSEPDHGHPVGIHSRRAVLEALIGLGAAVRRERPDVFLNVTSGTWLSPWWVRYANTIWMQGRDYGYADVPSISRRDAAITYRDVVLHQDFRVHDFWFPLANLMTHGIIKGHLQKLGGEAEPLDKFTDNAVLYLARGVAMWELYVSPDLLTDAEWSAIAEGMTWARDRFDLLRSTEMIGGDPAAREAYAYVHFAGERGVVAARNPFIEPSTLDLELGPALGLDGGASALVLERVYPTRWIAPRLYSAGETARLPLAGYETALYEIYPLEQAAGPLLAGAVFESGAPAGDGGVELTVLEAGDEVRLLDPDRVASLEVGGASLDPEGPLPRPGRRGPPARAVSVAETDAAVEIRLEVEPWVERATLALLWEPARPLESERHPSIDLRVDGAPAAARVERQDGRWSWHLADLGPGAHAVSWSVVPGDRGSDLAGSLGVWLLASHRPEGLAVTIRPAGPRGPARPMPPRPWPAGELRAVQALGRMQVGRAVGPPPARSGEP